MKYNEKVERCAPKLGRKNLANGLSCPPFVYMDDSDDGMWVHYVKYCENIAKQKYKRCLAMADKCQEAICYWDNVKYTFFKGEAYCFRKLHHYGRWGQIWLAIAEKFKPNKSTAQKGKG